MARNDLPSGTVTFLFTDVEGSTRLLHALGAEAYAGELAEHRRAIREACTSQGGVEVDTQGDAFFFVFPTAPGALAAAREMTGALASGPIRIRVGLHTGTPHATSDGYVGEDVHRAARIASAGHGGQVLVSQETRSQLSDDGSLVSLGAHRLKDFDSPLTLYQLGEAAFPALKTIANTNLPTPASSFLGREGELFQADQLLQRTRVLTIHGPGGQGKTRFALELARRAREERFSDYEDGVFACFLAPLRDHSLVLTTICQALSVREQPGLSALEALSSHLQGKQMLLLLDNLEHLLSAAGELSALLSTCPGLTLLATSRELLRISGELPYALPPLAEEEGISLFCERARSEPTGTIRELCSCLEGLPLAIELAAARMDLLSPEQLLGRLAQRLDLLKGTRDADPRQQTLRATIQWSFDLLSEAEQRLFARLSVFAGGCTLEAAEEVAEADLDSLESLLDKSLLRRSDSEHGPRFWMLETIREYAGERLEETGEGETWRGRHADWMLALSAAAEPGLEGPDVSPWLGRLTAELENLRAGLTFLGDVGRADDQLELAARSGNFWYTQGGWVEGRRWLEAALAGSSQAPTSSRATALGVLMWLSLPLGDWEAARANGEMALDIFRQLGDRARAAWLLNMLGARHSQLGEFDLARACFEEAIALARAGNDRARLAVAIANLAELSAQVGDFAAAIPPTREALEIVRELGRDDLVAEVLHNLSLYLARTGHGDDAAAPACQALVLIRVTGDVGTLAYQLVVAAALVAMRGEHLKAARLAGAAESLRELAGLPLIGLEADLSAETTSALRHALGDELYCALLDEGRRMSQADAIDEALMALTDA